MCCGKNRQSTPTPATNQPYPVRPSPQPAPSSPAFQYSGHSGMVVIGPVSGRAYRFAGPGARVEVDPRDGALLASVPNLRRTK
jgi:hypothetical protein